jgi:hypothetical protein
MKSFLTFAFPLVVLGLFAASIGYVAYRLHTLFGLTRRWPLRIAVAAGFVASLAAMLSAVRSTNAMAGVMNGLGGYYFSFYIFLTLLLLVLHAVQSKLKLPCKAVALSALVLALGITAAGALWANPFGVHEIEIPLDGLEQDAVWYRDIPMPGRCSPARCSSRSSFR